MELRIAFPISFKFTEYFSKAFEFKFISIILSRPPIIFTSETPLTFSISFCTSSAIVLSSLSGISLNKENIITGKPFAEKLEIIGSFPSSGRFLLTFSTAFDENEKAYS